MESLSWLDFSFSKLNSEAFKSYWGLRGKKGELAPLLVVLVLFPFNPQRLGAPQEKTLSFPRAQSSLRRS